MESSRPVAEVLLKTSSSLPGDSNVQSVLVDKYDSPRLLKIDGLPIDALPIVEAIVAAAF